MSAASPFRVSYEDYLEAEDASEERHEWSDGVVYAMSRGTPEHSRLMARIVTVLSNLLEGECEVFGPDVMLYIESARLSTYADLTVFCEDVVTKEATKNGKSLGEALTNPTVVVEVLSPATERYDRDGKFQAYKQLASMTEYVLVDQDEARIEVYRRAPEGEWPYEVAREGGRVTIHGAEVAVDEIYRALRRGT